MGDSTKENGEFAAHMEQVLETYSQPYDERFPVLLHDEQPVQLLEEINLPIAATKNHARRVDYEYGRAGTVSIFMFAEPLLCGAVFKFVERRTKIELGT